MIPSCSLLSISRRYAWLVSVIVMAGCSPSTPPQTTGEPAKKELPELQAATVSVAEQTWPFVVPVQGSLIAEEVSPIGAEVAGKVAQVHVDLGDEVAEGTPLVTLDDKDFQLQVTQAESLLLQARAAVGLKPEDPLEKLNVENAPPVKLEKALWDEAQTRLERVRSLQRQNATTEEALDTSIAENQAAEARYLSALNSVREKIATITVRMTDLEIAKQHLANTVIRAPFAGQVLEKQVAPGTYVQIGRELVTLVRSDVLRFRGGMPERYSQQVKLGQQLKLHVESVPTPISVTIDRISPSLNQANRSLAFEARVDNSSAALRTGLFAEAEVILNPDARAIAIPSSALVEFAGAERVWKVVDGKSHEQPVRTGQRRPEGIEIQSGLSVGDVILQEGRSGKAARIVSGIPRDSNAAEAKALAESAKP